MGYIKSDLKPSKNWATLDYVLNGNLYHLPGWCLFTNHGSVGQSSIKRRLAQQWCVMSFHWSIHICAGWWFGTCFFPIYWEFHHPIWLIFFRGVGIPPTRCQFWNPHERQNENTVSIPTAPGRALSSSFIRWMLISPTSMAGWDTIW